MKFLGGGKHMTGIKYGRKLFLVFAFDFLSGEDDPGISGERGAERRFYFEGIVDKFIVADAFVFDEV